MNFHYAVFAFIFPFWLFFTKNQTPENVAIAPITDTTFSPPEQAAEMPPPCNCTLTQGSFSSPLPFMSTNSSAVNFYAYGTPFGSSAGTGLEMSETLLVMLHEDLNTGNTSLIIIMDIANDATGGEADIVVSCLPDTAYVALQDDAGELVGSPPVITGDFFWSPCCTDGGIIGGVGCGNTITINPTIISGINDFSLVYGTPANPTYINMPDIQCPITINCGGAVCCENAFDIIATTQNPGCEGSSDGSIEIDTDCATNPTYQWSNGASGSTISNLMPGNYSLTITDENNCSQTASYDLTANSPYPEPIITGPYQFCTGSSTELGIDNAFSSYMWSTGSTNPTLLVTTPGPYSVTVTNSFGCTGTNTVTVAEYPVPTVSDNGEYCQGFTYVYPGNGQNYSAGNYMITFFGGTWQGCDSIVDLTVVEIPDAVSYLDEVICLGDYYDACGIPYDVTNNYEVDCSPGWQGCDSVINLTLTVLDPVAIINPPSGLGCNNPSTYIDATASNGTYFLWTTNDGLICDSPQNLYLEVCAPGTYCLTATMDVNSVSCDHTTCVTIAEGGEAPDLTLIGTDVSCNGDNNGSATVIVNNPAFGPFTFLWMPGSNETEVISNLTAGTYSVVVTSQSNGCTATQSITINEPELLAAFIDTQNNISCNGNSDGTATVIGNGGIAPYTYQWCNNQTTATATGLSAGQCCVTVSDANNCTAVSCADLTEPSDISLTTTQTEVACAGNNNGTATVNPSGGAGGFTYLWCNNQTTPTATGLGSGDCVVTVTDANGCSQTTSVTLTAPTALTIATNQNNISCNGGNDGTATATPGGGTAPYSYQWSNGQSNQTADNLGAGTATVTITDDNGCTATATVVLTEPANPITISGNSTSATCGSDNGSIDLSVSGGTPAYTYLWSGSGSTTEDLQNLGPGNYTVTVTDNNNCTETYSIAVDTPGGLSLATTPTNSSCNGATDGSIDLTVTGGTSPFSFNWDNGAGTSEDPGNLSAGTYNVTVTDAAGCTFVASETISQPLAITATANSTAVTCAGATDGSITLTINGGTSPYTFDWDNAANVQNPSGLASGNYNVTITDANDCTGTASASIAESASIELNITPANAACNGQPSGSINLVVNGGSNPYTFEWTGTASTAQNPTDLFAGAYSVTVTDNNGCTETISTQIGEPTALSISFTTVDASCGAANGSIGLMVTGGLSPYDYSWNNGAGSSNNPSGLAPGNYTVTVTDANNCSMQQSIQVGGIPPITLSINATDPSCNGTADGSINLTVSNGTAPFTYNWSGTTQNIPDPSGLPAGIYLVTVTDANGCTEIIDTELQEPEAIAITGTSEDASCGDNNGSIAIQVSGGNAPFTYLWSPGGSTQQNPSGLTPGGYTVVATDANGCTSDFSINVSTQSQLLLSTSSTDVFCNNGNDGTIALMVSGGVAPFSYQWDNGATTQNLSDLSAGQYCVTVTDDAGCEVLICETVSEPMILTATGSTMGVSCNGETDGTASVNVTGGTAPYTFNWPGTGETTATITNLPAGDQTVIVTDNNACTTSINLTVDEPLALSASTIPYAVSCNGGSDGSLEVTLSGGTAPYSFSWDNGDTNAAPTNLSAGVINGVVTDANACTLSLSILIEEPDPIMITGTATAETCGESNGAIDITVTGGTAPYSYLWTPGNYNTEDPNNVMAGNYTVVVTDVNGCSENYSISVSTPNALQGTATTSDVQCNGGTDGSIDISVSGGIPPFSYQWLPIAWTGQDLSDVPADTYSVIITDASGCSVTLSQSISEPSPIVLSATSTAALCGQTNGMIDLTVTGGVAPYSYLWSPGGSMLQDPSDLGPGNYTVEVTDANGCMVDYTVAVPSPSGLNSSALPTDVSCSDAADGSIDLIVNGGTAPFTYQWSYNNITTEDLSDVPTGTYSVTITDSDGCSIVDGAVIDQPNAITISGTTTDETCNSSNGSISISVNGGSGGYTYLWTPGNSTSQNPSALPDGSYMVVVTDVNGCTGNASFTVNEPNALMANTTLTNVACQDGTDGSITALITGGTMPYTYNWTPMGGTTAIAQNLPAGNYTLLVTDANGCTLALTETVTEPTAIVITGTSIQATCGEANGSIDLTLMGGTAPYTYLWSPGNMTTEDPNNIIAGSYSVTATDANGCTASYNIGVNTPNMLAASTTTQSASCHDNSDGNATVLISGGIAPYTFLWDYNNITTQTLNNVPAGTYTVSVTDDTGCEIVTSALVSQPDPLEITANSTPALCGDPIGSIDATVTGGVGPYSYLWSPGGYTTEDPANLGAGNYTVTVTDNNLCTETLSIQVVQPNNPTVTLSPMNTACYLGTDGGIDLNINGGLPPFTFEWSNGTNSQNLINVTAGIYWVSITDNVGCTFTYSETVGSPNELVASVLNPSNVSCNGGNDGSINLDVLGGTPPYIFDWDNAPDVQNPANLVVGNYNVTVMDANGCMAFANAELTAPLPISISVSTSAALCNNSDNGSASTLVSGGTSPYIYQWSNGSTDQNPMNLNAGIYQLTLTDNNACTETASATVTQPEAILLNVTALSQFGNYNISCAGASDGSAVVSATGGLPPFSYNWSNGTAGAAVTGLNAGSYEVIATDANACTATTQITLTSPEDLFFSAIVEAVSCYGESDGAIIIDSVAGGTGPYTYAIDGGAFINYGLFGNLSDGLYELTIQDINGCAIGEQIQLFEPAELLVEITGAEEIQLGDSVLLEALFNRDTSDLFSWAWTQGRFWHNGSDTCQWCQKRWVLPTETTTYEYTIVDDMGCVSSDQLQLRVLKDRPVFIPNAFSPNNDGRNEYFQIYTGAGVQQVKTFKVFNRWGEVVYELNNFLRMSPTDGWDGRFKGELMNPAVFAYFVEVEFIDGHVEIYKGDVTLMH